MTAGVVGGDGGAAGTGVLAVAAGLVPRGVGQPAAAVPRRAAPEPGPAVPAGVQDQAGYRHRRFGPDGRDTAVIDDLAARAAGLHAAAPDRSRGAAATFYAGLVEDNLRGDVTAARKAFAAALAAAQEAGDGLTESEALRHLGYHHGEDGEVEQARQMWERSAELRQRAGAVPYTLSQQLLLAGLARDAGDREEARAVAGQVRRWARALGIGVLESGAAELSQPGA
jgi:tetratricopeptide (TPR) repeat protein